MAFIVSLSAIFGSAVFYNHYVSPHRQLQKWIYSLEADKIHVADYDCLKLLNAAHGVRPYCPADSLRAPTVLAKIAAKAPYFYMHTWTRFDTEYNAEIAKLQNKNRHAHLAGWHIDTLFRLKTSDNIEFQTLKITK